MVGRGVPSHHWPLVFVVHALAPVVKKRLSVLVWEVAEQREGVDKALHIVEPAQVLCSVPACFRELHKSEVREKPVIHHPLQDNLRISFV